MEKQFEVEYKNGKKEIVNESNLPKFSSNFNRMIKNIKVGEDMYDVTSMTMIKRIKQLWEK